MAAKQLLPGYGNAYTSETITGTAGGAIGADTLDASRCAQVGIQITAVANIGSSTFKVQHTLDGVNWADLVPATTPVLGQIIRLGAFSGPYGKLRLKVTDAAGAVTIAFVVVGFELQGKS